MNSIGIDIDGELIQCDISPKVYDDRASAAQRLPCGEHSIDNSKSLWTIVAYNPSLTARNVFTFKTINRPFKGKINNLRFKISVFDTL